jgi:hypothetical protein
LTDLAGYYPASNPSGYVTSATSYTFANTNLPPGLYTNGNMVYGGTNVSASGISAAESTNIAASVTASMMLTGNTATATSAGSVTGAQSNTIAGALQAEADTLATVTARGNRTAADLNVGITSANRARIGIDGEIGNATNSLSLGPYAASGGYSASGGAYIQMFGNEAGGTTSKGALQLSSGNGTNDGGTIDFRAAGNQAALLRNSGTWDYKGNTLSNIVFGAGVNGSNLTGITADQVGAISTNATSARIDTLNATVIKAITSGGGTLQNLAGETCLTWGAGGKTVSTADGLMVNGVITGNGSGITNMTAEQVGAIPIGGTASNVTPAAIVAAGGVLLSPVVSSNLLALVANGTCSVPYRADAPATDQQFHMAQTQANVLAMGAFDTNTAWSLPLSWHTMGNQLTYCPCTFRTNIGTMRTNAWNLIIASRPAFETNWTATVIP